MNAAEVRSLSDPELSRLLAEKLEPMPTCDRSMGFVTHTPDWIEEDGDDYYSTEKQCWIHTYCGDGKWSIVPRDFCNDPAMTVMLLELLLRHGINFIGSRWDSALGEWTAFQVDGTVDCTDYEFEQIGRIAAESALLALEK